MTVRCKSLCGNYASAITPGLSRYADGQSRCITCDVYVKWEGIFCPCCGGRLRKKPRRSLNKEILRNKLLNNPTIV